MKIQLIDGHKYLIDKKTIVPSVTTIIDDIIPYKVYIDTWYLQRGTAVHACAKLIAENKKFNYDPQIEGYINSIKKFFDEIKPVVKFTEIPVYSNLFNFAGTIDLVAKINGINYIIDYKNSIDFERLKLQLAGYSIALKETKNILINNGFGVHLKEDGSYQLTERININNIKNEFIILRKAYHIKERVLK